MNPNPTPTSPTTDMIPRIVSCIRDHRAVLLVGHINPDADSLGSMLALARSIEETEVSKTCCALPHGSVSRRLQYLVDLAQPHLADPDQGDRVTCMIVCDTAKPRRANLPEHACLDTDDSRWVINIDHHVSNTLYGNINWIDAHAGSTSEMIYRLIRGAGWTLDPVTATLLYAGMHGDTLGFSINTTVQVLSAAADLVRCGADLDGLGRNLWWSVNKNEFDLRRIVFDNTRLSPTGRIVFSTLNHDEIRSTGCSAADIDDQVEIPRSMQGTCLAIMFSEGHPGKIRVNLRSKDGFSVLELARQLGGGGHHQAAGVIIHGTLDQAVATLLPLAEQHLDPAQK